MLRGGAYKKSVELWLKQRAVGGREHRRVRDQGVKQVCQSFELRDAGRVSPSIEAYPGNGGFLPRGIV